VNKFFYACFLPLSIIFNSSFVSFGQDKAYIDSLKEIIETTDNDSIKVDAYVKWDEVIYITDRGLDQTITRTILEICNQNLAKTRKRKRNQI